MALVVACLALAGCVASETVTVSDTAVAAATSTARSDDPPPSADDEATAAPSPADDEPTPAPPTAVPPTAVPQESADAGDNECRFDSIDTFGDVQIELTFTSDLTVQDDAYVNYVVYDGNGDEFVTSEGFVEDLKPGEQVRMVVDTVEDAPVDAAARNGITCEFAGIQLLGLGVDPFRPGPTDSCRFVEVDSFDDIQIEISLENPASSSGELAVDYALRSADGIRFGDGVAYTDVLDPGQRFTGDEDTVTEFPAWVDPATFSCEILAIVQF